MRLYETSSEYEVAKVYDTDEKQYGPASRMNRSFPASSTLRAATNASATSRTSMYSDA